MNVISKDTFIVEVISRECIEQCNLVVVEKVIERLKTMGTDAEGRLAILFDGYNDVSEEVYEIPEIRAWINALVGRYPYIFYFLTEMNDNIHMIAAAVADVKKLQAATT